VHERAARSKHAIDSLVWCTGSIEHTDQYPLALAATNIQPLADFFLYSCRGTQPYAQHIGLFCIKVQLSLDLKIEHNEQHLISQVAVLSELKSSSKNAKIRQIFFVKMFTERQYQ